jgi:putative transposase
VVEHTGFRYRLYPTPEQEAALRRWAGCARAVWNAALEQRETARRMGQRVGWAAQDRELTDAKRALPWLREPASDVLQQTLRDLDRAYVNFFAGRARRPKFRRAERTERFRIQSRPSKQEIEIRRVGRRLGLVRLPKLGWMRFRWSRVPNGEIKHLTISRDALGWHVSFCCKREVERPVAHIGAPVAIDRGVANTITLSTGHHQRCPGLPPGQLARLRRLTRRAGRQETVRRRPVDQCRRSRRHQRTLTEIAKLRAREARIRNDFLHDRSTDIAKHHGVVVIEDLNMRAMTRSAKGTIDQPGTGVRAKAGLNRAILAQGWGKLRHQLAYKLERRGGRLIPVNARYTSQECARCGTIDSRSRTSQAAFRCVACGHRDHADVNAARVLLARAGYADREDRGRTRPWQRAEPSEKHGDEARTPDGSAHGGLTPSGNPPHSCAGRKSTEDGFDTPRATRQPIAREPPASPIGEATEDQDPESERGDQLLSSELQFLLVLQTLLRSRHSSMIRVCASVSGGHREQVPSYVEPVGGLLFLGDPPKPFLGGLCHIVGLEEQKVGS